MKLSFLTCWLIAVNIAGFVLVLTSKNKRRIGTAGVISALLGGSSGVLIAELLFGRKTDKNNALSRVLLACLAVWQVVIVLCIRSGLPDAIRFDFGAFFAENRLLTAYLIGINAVTLVVFAADKLCAVKNRRRVRIATLLALTFIGGSPGALLGMVVFRHKTQKTYFTAGVPAILITHLVLLLYLMNR